MQCVNFLAPPPQNKTKFESKQPANPPPLPFFFFLTKTVKMEEQHNYLYVLCWFCEDGKWICSMVSLVCLVIMIWKRSYFICLIDGILFVCVHVVFHVHFKCFDSWTSCYVQLIGWFFFGHIMDLTAFGALPTVFFLLCIFQKISW